MKKIFLPALLLVSLPALCSGAGQLTGKSTNKLQLPRASQTIEISEKELAPLQEKNLETIHVKDSSGKEVLCQAVDTDFDEYHKRDTIIFQADFAPGETRTFTLLVGKKHSYKKDDFKAYGRLNQERFDDYAWENDLIAHRTYGKGLETWKEEALISSTIDIWSKKTPKMVIDGWYMADNYHEDAGEGCDYYSAGTTRGDGGNGLWANNQLYTSKNFINSRVLANGPIRVCFELDYDAFGPGGNGAPIVTERKRVTLDAGSNLDHYQSFYTPYVVTGRPVNITSGSVTMSSATGSNLAIRGQARDAVNINSTGTVNVASGFGIVGFGANAVTINAGTTTATSGAMGGATMGTVGIRRADACAAAKRASTAAIQRLRSASSSR